MLNFVEYCWWFVLLVDWLLWVGLVVLGVVLNKDGSFQCMVWFCGFDFDSVIYGELIVMLVWLNNVLCCMGLGWVLFIEVEC